MIKVTQIPKGYRIMRWGYLGNREKWYNSPSQAYFERRMLLKYNKQANKDQWLVYHNKAEGCYTLLEKENL